MINDTGRQYRKRKPIKKWCVIFFLVLENFFIIYENYCLIVRSFDPRTKDRSELIHWFEIPGQERVPRAFDGEVFHRGTAFAQNLKDRA